MHKEFSSKDPIAISSNISMYRHLFNGIKKVIIDFFRYSLAIIFGTFEIIVFCINQRIFGHKLPNYSQVIGGKLFRGGQPSFDGLQELANRGIKTIVNLRCDPYTTTIRGIKVYNLPFYPDEPTDSVVLDCLKILISPKNQPAFVHCFHGADRTGTICAVYRIIMQGWEKEKAIIEMKAKGLHFWHKNLIRYIQNLDVSKMREKLGLI